MIEVNGDRSVRFRTGGPDHVAPALDLFLHECRHSGNEPRVGPAPADMTASS
jgi:hypothetical protein